MGDLMDAFLIIWPIFAWCLLSATWVLYVAIMSLKTRRDAGTLPWPAKLIGYPVLFVGLAFDVAFNWLVGSAIFFELPHELLFTARCQRHYPTDTWRGATARWLCTNLLDPFDKGHCQ